MTTRERMDEQWRSMTARERVAAFTLSAIWCHVTGAPRRDVEFNLAMAEYHAKSIRDPGMRRRIGVR